MRHVPDGTLRRITDEPLAVADRDVRHMTSCARCRARRGRVAADATFAEHIFSPRASFSGPDLAWARHQGRMSKATTGPTGRARPQTPLLASYGYLSRHRSGLAAAGAVLAGVAAAATLTTTVFAPTRVAPLAVSKTDMRALAGLLDIQSPAELLGFSKPSGSETTPFGAVHWTSSGEGSRVSSLGAAEASTGLSARYCHQRSPTGSVRLTATSLSRR